MPSPRASSRVSLTCSRGFSRPPPLVSYLHSLSLELVTFDTQLLQNPEHQRCSLSAG